MIFPGADYSIYGTMSNPNLHSILLMLLLPFSFYALCNLEIRIKFISIISILISLCNIYIAGTRSVYLGLITMLLFICALAFYSIYNNVGYKKWLIL